MGKRYTQLSHDERFKIYELLAAHKSLREIAKTLGRSPSSISREIKRNCPQKENVYFPDTANSLSIARRNKPLTKIERSKDLAKTIEDSLAMGWSPEVIAGRLELDSGKQIISHESIYKYTYKAGLQHLLLRKKRKRGQRSCRKANQSKIPGRVSIHKRPESYETEFGHWECDTVYLAGHKEVILTMYERKTKLLLGAKMSTRTASETIDFMKTIIDSLPVQARRSLTFDNGSEFFEHQQLVNAFDLETYFCDAYASWQKGGVENANGILRRFVPKKTKTEDCSAEQVQEYLKRINSTPRKSLGYKTPYEFFLQEVTKQTIILNLITSSVALQN
jgi:transposase, IS30 family